MTNKHSISSFDEDFGFTTVDEKELVKVQTDDLSGQVEELTLRLQQMYDSIMPLLRNLNKNCDQEIIKWPNRNAKLVDFKLKLDKIGGPYIKEKSL
jgi:hypothetical protein